MRTADFLIGAVARGVVMAFVVACVLSLVIRAVAPGVMDDEPGTIGVVVWLSAAAVGTLAGRRTWRKRNLWLRRIQRRCLNCGYDLRATPERCPECGKAVSEGAEHVGAGPDPPV